MQFSRPIEPDTLGLKTVTKNNSVVDRLREAISDTRDI